MLTSLLILPSLFGLAGNNLWIAIIGCLALKEHILSMVAQPLTFISDLCASFGLATLTSLTFVPSLASERILGMQPLTFACFVIPIIVQVVILVVWAVKWRSPD